MDGSGVTGEQAVHFENRCLLIRDRAVGNLQSENTLSQLEDANGDREACVGREGETANGIDSEELSVNVGGVDEEVLVGESR